MKIITDFIDNTVGGPGLGTQNTHESNSNSSNNGNGLRPLAGSDITGSVNNTHRPDFGPEPTNDKIEKIKADLKIKIQELLHILDGQNIRIQKLLDKLAEIKKQIEELDNEIKKLEDEITALTAENANEQTDETKELDKELLIENSKIQKITNQLDKWRKIVKEKEDIINEQDITIIKTEKERDE